MATNQTTEPITVGNSSLTVGVSDDYKTVVLTVALHFDRNALVDLALRTIGALKRMNMSPAALEAFAELDKLPDADAMR